MKHFRGNSEKTSLFSPKSDFLRKENRKTHKFVFLKIFENRQTLRKIWTCLNNCFWSNQWNGGYINKNSFSPQSKPHTAKLCFSVVLKHFRGNSQRTSLFRPKSGYLRKEDRNTHKVCFSWHVWKWENPDENLDVFKELFLIKPLKGDKYQKKKNFPQSEPYKLKYVFLLFCSIFAEIHRELLFLVQKFTISGKSTELLRFVFLNMFENVKILRKNWICLNNFFLSNQWKRKNI